MEMDSYLSFCSLVKHKLYSAQHTYVLYTVLFCRHTVFLSEPNDLLRSKTKGLKVFAGYKLFLLQKKLHLFISNYLL